MYAAARQLPDEPGIDGAKQKLSPLRARPRARHVFKNPAQLCAGKIGVDYQPRFFPNRLRQPPRAQLVAVFRGAAALPDDGVVYRLSRGPVPHHGGFPLVGDADRRDVLRPRAGLSHRLLRDADLRIPYLHGIVLYPARLWIILIKLLLRDAANLALSVEQDAAVTRGAGIQRHDVFCHSLPSFNLDALPVSFRTGRPAIGCCGNCRFLQYSIVPGAAQSSGGRRAFPALQSSGRTNRPLPMEAGARTSA